MKIFRKLWLQWIPQYEQLELKFASYAEADKLIRECNNKAESGQWHIAKEEDINLQTGWVFIERRARIWE